MPAPIAAYSAFLQNNGRGITRHARADDSGSDGQWPFASLINVNRSLYSAAPPIFVTAFAIAPVSVALMELSIGIAGSDDSANGKKGRSEVAAS